MKKREIKEGDIVTFTSKSWGKGVGYVYNSGHSLCVGASFKEGGVTNINLSDLKITTRVKLIKI